MVHGLGEHSGRYKALAERFVERGYTVFAFDHPGHGQTAGKRAFVRRFSEFTDNLLDVVRRVRTGFPNLPLYLYGHSMGGLISVHFLAEHQALFRAAVVSAAPAGIPSHVSRATIVIGRLLSRLIPGMGLVPLEADGVSRDPAVVDAYKADPLVHHGRITARLASELMIAMERLPAAAARIRLPVLTMNGSADTLVDAGDTARLHGLLPDDIDKTLHQYEGLHHEIHNEPEREQVLSDVLDWLAARQ